jgi:hypothetical protein
MAAEEEGEISPTRVRIGLGLIMATIVIAIGLFVTVNDPAPRFIFAAIIVIGLFQMWRLFRTMRRS